MTSVPFNFVRVPEFGLKTPQLPTVTAMKVFVLIYVSYFVVTSGVIYDIVAEPPSMGSERDEVTGTVQPVAFLKYRVNGQFIIEGLTAGMTFFVGSLGFILLDLATKQNRSPNMKFYFSSAGIGMIVVSYMLTMLFLKIKLPNMGY